MLFCLPKADKGSWPGKWMIHLGNNLISYVKQMLPGTDNNTCAQEKFNLTGRQVLDNQIILLKLAGLTTMNSCKVNI
jgi:hypothetical protein